MQKEYNRDERKVSVLYNGHSDLVVLELSITQCNSRYAILATPLTIYTHQGFFQKPRFERFVRFLKPLYFNCVYLHHWQSEVRRHVIALPIAD